MNEAEKRIESWLIQIGIMPNLTGFTYIKESVELCCGCFYGRRKTTQIYDVIAKRYGKSSSAVESNIRHAIQVASNSNKIIRLNNVVGQTVISGLDKPSAGQLIALLVQKQRSMGM